MTACVIGVGNRSAGDDGVGLAVVQRLREMGAPAGVALAEVPEPSGLIPVLESGRPVVLVDAVVGGGVPGKVLRLTPERLGAPGATPLSTHGISVPQAIDLAHTLAPDGVSPRIVIVGVVIAAAERYCDRLSPPVAEAVDRAAAEVLDIVGGVVTGG